MVALSVQSQKLVVPHAYVFHTFRCFRGLTCSAGELHHDRWIIVGFDHPWSYTSSESLVFVPEAKQSRMVTFARCFLLLLLLGIHTRSSSMNIERRKLFSPVVAKVKEAAEQAEDFLFGGTRSWCSGLKNPVVNRGSLLF